MIQLQKCCLFDTAAEQKARATYEHLMVLTDDPAIINPLRFLREREIVHFQRFGEAKREVSSKCPGGGKPTPAPLCNLKSKEQTMLKLSRD